MVSEEHRGPQLLSVLLLDTFGDCGRANVKHHWFCDSCGTVIECALNRATRRRLFALFCGMTGTDGRASLRWRGICVDLKQRKAKATVVALAPNRVSLGAPQSVRGITRLLKEFRSPAAVYLSTIETPARNLPKNEI